MHACNSVKYGMRYSHTDDPVHQDRAMRTNKALTASLIRQQLETQLERWRAVPPRPREGWIKSIRKALGMPASALASRLRVSSGTLTNLERAERQGTISLRSLREAAEALDCELVYALVPRTTLDEVLRQRALRVVDALMRKTTHTMSLEDQGVSERETKRQREALAAQLVLSLDRRLWIDRQKI